MRMIPLSWWNSLKLRLFSNFGGLSVEINAQLFSGEMPVYLFYSQCKTLLRGNVSMFQSSMMTRRIFYPWCLCLLLVQHAFATDAQIDIYVDRPKAALSPVLYGLFFEDINYSADGGLYAEMIQNRSFEYFPVEGWAEDSQTLHPLSAWSKVERNGGKVKLSVTDERPLNKNNTKYLAMSIQSEGTVGVRNSGFEGIVLKKGAAYDLSLYARRDQDLSQPVHVALVTKVGGTLAAGTISNLSDDWKKYELTLTSKADAADARLELTTSGTGNVTFDMVSLFPQDTFKGRKNGLRKDLAQALADLKPGFLRFPGGCIVHGQGLANAYRWKDTVGDVAERKPNWNLWGYHQSYGLGYFEYMQLCEDIGATPLPVVPVGVACGFRQPFDKVPLDQLQPWIDDALDLIEFANGPVDSQWGRIRAEMGHPEPFGLQYICLGNEEHDTPEVRERFPRFVEPIRAKYPDIKIIGTSGLGPEIPLFDMMVQTRVYSSDEHYYMPPSWYLKNTHRFDTFDRKKPMVFVGEYASEGNALINAIAEAAYLTGVERNADIVDMTCYAPLFAKYDRTQWTKANLIWFDNQQVVRTPNFYVQQLFGTNKGDVYCANAVKMDDSQRPKSRFEGKVGVGTWRTTIEVAQATLNDVSLDLDEWDSLGGSFQSNNGVLSQRDPDVEGCLAISRSSAKGDHLVYGVRARKIAGNEGFLIVFGDRGKGNLYWWNVGGWGNTQHGIERRVGKNSVERLATTQGHIEHNRWYDLRVELKPGSIRCYLDGRLVHDYREDLPDVFVSSTIDQSSGELIVKLVNPDDAPLSAEINIRGAQKVAKQGTLTTLSGPAYAVNDRNEETVVPQERDVRTGPTTGLRLPSTSLQVLRLSIK